MCVYVLHAICSGTIAKRSHQEIMNDESKRKKKP